MRVCPDPYYRPLQDPPWVGNPDPASELCPEDQCVQCGGDSRGSRSAYCLECEKQRDKDRAVGALKAALAVVQATDRCWTEEVEQLVKDAIGAIPMTVQERARVLGEK